MHAGMHGMSRVEKLGRVRLLPGCIVREGHDWGTGRVVANRAGCEWPSRLPFKANVTAFEEDGVWDDPPLVTCTGKGEFGLIGLNDVPTLILGD